MTKMIVKIGSPRGGFGTEAKPPVVVEVEVDLADPRRVYQLSAHGCALEIIFPAPESGEGEGEKPGYGAAIARGGAFC